MGMVGDGGDAPQRVIKKKKKVTSVFRVGVGRKGV